MFDVDFMMVKVTTIIIMIMMMFRITEQGSWLATSHKTPRGLLDDLLEKKPSSSGGTEWGCKTSRTLVTAANMLQNRTTHEQ